VLCMIYSVVFKVMTPLSCVKWVLLSLKNVYVYSFAMKMELVCLILHRRVCVEMNEKCATFFGFNPLAPSDPYMGRTAQLTSRRCILNPYS
jgi:hypothetical protein